MELVHLSVANVGYPVIHAMPAREGILTLFRNQINIIFSSLNSIKPVACRGDTSFFFGGVEGRLECLSMICML